MQGHLAFVLAFLRRARVFFQRETGVNMIVIADKPRHFQIQRLRPPHRQIFLRLSNIPLRLALVRLDLSDTAVTHIRALLVFRQTQGGMRPFLPVFRTFKEHHGAFHAVFNTLRIPSRAAFAVMANQDRLSERDNRRQRVHLRERLL
ncbi:Uncharacterised protein [Salmonella enterica subsp. enterica serovar Bovismorbificans]|nr:Uncharacterised protein [Salmonella enterica subsp. enterica serovar Bovismorbificans]